MEDFEKNGTLDFGHNLNKGFSKAQILKLSSKDIEDLDLLEHPQDSADDKRDQEEVIPKEKKTGYSEPNEGGPRPPKEDEYPDAEEEGKDALLSEVSDPNEKD